MFPALASCKLLLSHTNDLIDNMLIRLDKNFVLRDHDFNLRLHYHPIILISEFLSDLINIVKVQA